MAKSDYVVTLTAPAVIRRRIWIKGAKDAAEAEAVALEQLARSETQSGFSLWRIHQRAEIESVSVENGVTDGYALVIGEQPPGQVGQPPIGHTTRLDMTKMSRDDIAALTKPKRGKTK